MPRYYALVPAAGSGSRCASEVPKQYLELAGRPLIYHALAALCAFPRIDRVCVILAPGDAWWETFDWSDLGAKLQTVFCGGATRSETVANGLAAAAGLADDDWVLVHDAVRPCLAQDMLAALCDQLADDPVGGLLAVPVSDTLKRADAQQRVAATESRDGLWQAQTPQMFRYALLSKALAAVDASVNYTDEAGAIEAAGLTPRLVRADASNLKVTYAPDLQLAQRILQGRGM